MLNDLLMRMRSLLRRATVESELADELGFHLEEQIEKYVASGLTPQEARRRARLEFGGLEQVKEECRQTRGVHFIETLFQDIRFGLRMLRKSPGFTAVSVLTLAVGIGANTAIFSVVDAVLFRPLAIKEPSGVMYLQETWRDMFPGISVGNFVDLQRQGASFAKLCASHNASFNLALQTAPERVDGEYATGEYFATFGVHPIAGRVFSNDEDHPGRDQVVVISERLWRTHFHADLSTVGQPLRINGMPHMVIGVMPKSFDPLLINSDVWIPAAFTAEQITDHDDHYLNVMGRLKAGVSTEQAQSELNTIAERLQREYPMDDKDRGFRLTPLATILLGDQKPVMWIMVSAVGFVLLIACANIANLQLARSRVRQKEIAVRIALGASSRRIVRQLLVENVLLGLVSGAGGVLLAFLGISWIIARGPADVPRLDQSRVDGIALTFACCLVLLSSLLFGLAPALRSASARLTAVFKESTGTSSGSHDRVRSMLVVGEIALALVLMTGAGLLIRSALLVSHLDPGFDTSHLIVGRVGLPDAAYHDPVVARQAFERMMAAATALPGAQAAAVVSRAPLAGGDGSNGLVPEGKAIDSANAVNAQLQIVSPTYLATVRIPLKSGRNFTALDTRDRLLVSIVNETLARTIWPGENPIGKRFVCCEAGPKGREDPVWHEVVGVAGDVRAWGLDRQVQPQFYLPLAQIPPSAWDWIGRTMDLVVREQGVAIPPDELQRTVASIAPGVPIYQLSTMQQKIAGTLESSHFYVFLLSLFAATALLLSSVGIYGVLSYVVAQRTRDIGIRMALGATHAQVLRHVLVYGARLTIVGLLLGLAGAMAGTRVLSSLLYGVRATDAITFAAVSLILATVAFIANYLPARSAMRVNPIVALRHE
jgi:putative ABC transport system permease protein